MTTHRIEGFLYHVHYDFQSPDEFDVRFHTSDGMGQHGPDWVLIGPHSFEVEIPDDFDPRPLKVAALREKEQQIRAEFAKSIADIQSQINSLLALEMA